MLFSCSSASGCDGSADSDPSYCPDADEMERGSDSDGETGVFSEFVQGVGVGRRRRHDPCRGHGSAIGCVHCWIGALI